MSEKKLSNDEMINKIKNIGHYHIQLTPKCDKA